MAKKRNKNRRIRRRTSVKLHELTRLITPQSLQPQFIRNAKVRRDLPVHIGGTISNIDPRNPDGLSPLQREAVREAHSFLHCRAAVGVGISTTATIQTHFGWVVRNRHGDEDTHREPESLTVKLDTLAQSQERVRQRREGQDQGDLAMLLKNKALRQQREQYQRAIFEAEMSTYL